MIKYYYLKNDEGRVVLTVCLIAGRDRVARGVAILSARDTHCKKTARAIALGRARKALQTQENNSPVLRREAIDALVGLHVGSCGIPEFYRLSSVEWWKSYSNPRPTDFERRLFTFHLAHTRPNQEPSKEKGLLL